MNRRFCAGILVLVTATTTLPAQDAPIDKPLRVRVSEGVLYGIVIKTAYPTLPCSTDKSHQKGKVTVGLLVGYDGKVKSTTPMSGDTILTECAMRAISRWEFKPYLINGTPAQVESRVVMKFTAKRAEVVPASR